MDTTVSVRVFNITRQEGKAIGDYEVRGLPDVSAIVGLIETGTVAFDNQTYEFSVKMVAQKLSSHVPSFFHSKRLRIDNSSETKELREIFSPTRIREFERAEEGADIWEQSCNLK